jgi:hypothetical protein
VAWLRLSRFALGALPLLRQLRILNLLQRAPTHPARLLGERNTKKKAAWRFCG